VRRCPSAAPERKALQCLLPEAAPLDRRQTCRAEKVPQLMQNVPGSKDPGTFVFVFT